MSPENLKPTTFYENRVNETQKPVAIPSSSAIMSNRKVTEYRIVMAILWGMVAISAVVLIAAVIDGSAGAGWVAVASFLQLFGLLLTIAFVYVVQRVTQHKK